MPKKNGLNDRQLKALKPIDKHQYLFDSGGLFLYIPKIGNRYTNKYWRFKYTFNGKTFMMGFGTYPETPLSKAREKTQDARQLLKDGINPQDHKKQQEKEAVKQSQLTQNTFEHISRQWFETAKSGWSEGHSRTITSRLNRDVLPMLGSRPIHEITAKDILETLRLVEARGAYESTHRIKTIIGQVFDYAIVSSVPNVELNPARGLSKALVKPQKKNMAAILEPGKFGRLLKDIDSYNGSHIVRCALRFAPLLFVRSGELRNMKWNDVDLEKGVWNVPIEDMKLTVSEKAARKGDVHIVPLSQQSIGILKELQPFTGNGQYVFPGRSSSRIISENTLNLALRNLGWGKETVVIHGFRATARTLLHETLGFSPDAIEAQLGHKVPDRLGDAYNRTKFLEERKRMMQAWGDYLEQLKKGC